MLITPSINTSLSQRECWASPATAPSRDPPIPFFGDNLGAEFPAPIPTTANQKTIQKRPQIPLFLLLSPHKSSASELGSSLTPHLPAPARPFPSPAATWSLDNRDSGKPSGPGGAPPTRGSPQIQGKPPRPRSLGFFACSSKVHVQGGESAMGRVVVG